MGRKKKSDVRLEGAEVLEKDLEAQQEISSDSNESVEAPSKEKQSELSKKDYEAHPKFDKFKK